MLAIALYAACAVWATWPAIRHVDGHYLARPAAGHGEAAAGDHLQLGWAFWLVGHQLERGASPLSDPYSFRPEAEAPPNLQGWLLGVPYWPLAAAFGDVWAYDLVVLLSFVLAGGLACWWLRSLGVSPRGRARRRRRVLPDAVPGRPVDRPPPRARLVPAARAAPRARATALRGSRRWCSRRSRFSGQLHLAIGAIPLALGYAWARTPRSEWWKACAGAAGAVAAGLVVQQWAVAGSIGTGRSFAQVDRYSAELADFVTRAVGSGVEELVFVGWLTPLLALLGLVAIRGRTGLAVLLGLAALVPCLLALGGNLPGYETLWRRFPGLDATRVPERFMPIACLALAALVAFGLDRLTTLVRARQEIVAPLVAAGVLVALAVDLRVPGVRRRRGERCTARPMPRSVETAGCSSSRSSVLTCTTAASTSRTHGRARGSGRRATRLWRSRAPSAWHASSAGSRAVAGRSRPTWESGSLRSTAASTGRAASSRPTARRGPRPCCRTAGWRLLARDGPISTYGALDVRPAAARGHRARDGGEVGAP